MADELAVKRQVGETSLSQQIEQYHQPLIQHKQFKEPPMDYINSLPWFKAALLRQAQPKWDTGVTATMVQTNYDYIDSLTGILVTLANYYSPEQFGDQSPQEYFSEIISSRFQWHRVIAEPHGPGTGGTIINVTIGGNVIDDVEKMIEDIVMALLCYEAFLQPVHFSRAETLAWGRNLTSESTGRSSRRACYPSVGRIIG